MPSLPSSRRLRTFVPGLLVASVACGGAEEIPPDGVWNVTVKSAIVDNNGQQSFDSDCIGEDQTATVYNQTFKYELFYEGEAVHIDIDGQSFGDGTRAGCNLQYESSIWLDERGSGKVTWYVEGAASYRGSAGGCDNQLEAGVDWFGFERIIVVESEDESIPVGCEYNMETTGTVVSGG